MRKFCEILEVLELCDIPLQEGLFAWKGGFDKNGASRLDGIYLFTFFIGKCIYQTRDLNLRPFILHTHPLYHLSYALRVGINVI